MYDPNKLNIPRSVSHVFIAIDLEVFPGAKDSIAKLSSSLASKGITHPGQYEQKNLDERKVFGIPILKEKLELLQSTYKSFQGLRIVN